MASLPQLQFLSGTHSSSFSSLFLCISFLGLPLQRCMPQIEWLKQQKCIFLHFRTRSVRSTGQPGWMLLMAVRDCSVPGSSAQLVDGPFLPCVSTSYSLCICLHPNFSYKDIRHIEPGLPWWPQCNLISSIKTLSPNVVPFRGIGH